MLVTLTRLPNKRMPQHAFQALPPAAMFENFGVNSLSAFRRKFWAYELRPHTSSHGCSNTSVGSAATKLSGLSGTRSRWGAQQAGDETYVGELLDGQRHGCGILLTRVRVVCKGRACLPCRCAWLSSIQQAAQVWCGVMNSWYALPPHCILPLQALRAWVLHVGRFAEGKRNGPGVVATSRGERFEGFFLDDLMWGPGVYRFAPPVPVGSAPVSCSDDGGGAAAAAEGSEQGAATGTASPSGATQQAATQAAGCQPHRICFRGMMNGRPAGKGCLEWSDGTMQAGQFDGSICYLAMREEDVAGVLLVAADNAQEARIAAAEVQAAAAQQQPDVAQQALQLFASVELPHAEMPA